MYHGYTSSAPVPVDGARLVLERLGRRVRSLRKGAGLTLAELSACTGLSLGYLSQVELAKNSPSLETLYRIARALGVRIVDLLAE